jgi:hypothetical protein
MSCKKQAKTNYTFVLKDINTTEVDRRFEISLSSNIEDTETNSTKNTTNITDIISNEPSRQQLSGAFIDQTNNYIIGMMDSVVSSTLDNNLCCFWCRHHFTGKAIGCPISYKPNRLFKQFTSEITNENYTLTETITDQLRETDAHVQGKYYETEGVFCSFNCCLAYIKDHMYDSRYKQSEVLLNKFYRTIFPNDKFCVIKPSPSWKLLQEYGGNLNIDDFRKSSSQYIYIEKNYTVQDFPKIQPIGSVFEQQYIF